MKHYVLITLAALALGGAHTVHANHSSGWYGGGYGYPYAYGPVAPYGVAPVVAPFGIAPVAPVYYGGGAGAALAAGATAGLVGGLIGAAASQSNRD